MKVALLTHIERILTERDVRYQQRFEAQTSAINAALQAAKEAVIKAENATERRFEAVNEFRQTLSDQAGTFVSRAEYNALKERMDRGEGRGSGLSAGWGYIVGAGGLIVVAIAVVTYLTRQPIP